MLRNARSYAGVATHSVCKHTHEENIILTITGHELFFFITRVCGTKGVWALRLHDEYTYQAVDTHTQQ